MITDQPSAARGRGRKTQVQLGVGATSLSPQVSSNPTDVHVGAQIRLRRLELGLTQSELAGGIGVNVRQIQKYERGLNRVSSSRLFDLAGALHVSVSYFFDGLPNLGVVGHDAALEAAQDKSASLSSESETLGAYSGFDDPVLRDQIWQLAMALTSPHGDGGVAWAHEVRVLNDVEAGKVNEELLGLGFQPGQHLRVAVEAVDVNAPSITAINGEGGAFDWLDQEPDLYGDHDLVERFR